MLSASRPVGSFMKKSDFETAQVSGFTSWPKRWISAFGLIGGLRTSPFFRSPTVMCSFDHQHAAGAAARVADGGHHPMAPDSAFVAGEHQVDHQVDDIARGEVL